MQGLGDAAKKLPDRPAPHDHQHVQTDEDEQQNDFLNPDRKSRVPSRRAPEPVWGIRGKVPLPVARADEVWQSYSVPWQLWNTVRAVAAGAVLLLAGAGLRGLAQSGERQA